MQGIPVRRQVLQHVFLRRSQRPHQRQQLPLGNAIGLADAGGLRGGGAGFFVRRGAVSLQGNNGFDAIMVGLFIDKSHNSSELQSKSQGWQSSIETFFAIVLHFRQKVKAARRGRTFRF
ncbi:MAG TPA: hypothetical protein DIU32_03860 [Oscillibacter sp.]|nr:hypothetical protein [Oscillibacter sp.]